MPRNAQFRSGMAFFASSFLFFAISVGTAQAQGEDVAVTDVTVDSQCLPLVTLTNTGTQPLSATAYDMMLGPTIQFYKNNQTVSGWRLGAVDSARKLKDPGGTLSWSTSSTKLTGTVELKVVFDPDNVLKEPNRGNNTLIKSITCNPPLPDLRLSAITFTSDCHPSLQVDNIGDGSLPDNAYTSNYGVYLQRIVDGNPTGQIYLGSLDPAKALKAPGGSVAWTDAQTRPGASVEYRLNRVGQEKSTANNILAVAVPQQCQSATTVEKPDLAVTELTVDDQCQVVVSLANTGSQPLDVTAYDLMLGPTIQLYKNNQTLSGWRLGAVDSARNLKNSGGTLTWTAGGIKLTGTAQIKAVIDPDNVLKETNRSNNTLVKSLSCSPPLPDLKLSAISFDANCLTTLNVENAGDAPLASNAYSTAYGAYIQRFVDGRPMGQIHLNSLDPAKKLTAPGGAVMWTDSQEYKAKENVKYQLNRTGQEKSAANNVLEATVPDKCKAGSAPQPRTRTLPSRTRELPTLKR